MAGWKWQETPVVLLEFPVVGDTAIEMSTIVLMEMISVDAV